MAEAGASELTPPSLSRTNSGKSRHSKKLPGFVVMFLSFMKLNVFCIYTEKLALERETKRTEFTSIGL